MEPVSTITGTAAPLPRAHIDTDQIIPKQFLKRIERAGFGEFLFYDWALDSEGEKDHTFILNRPEYAESVILVAGQNFGSGSSREHAPWALEDWGFRAIIAPSFADIFSRNATNVGLLPIVLTTEEVHLLANIAEDPDNIVTVDLETQTVSADGFLASFDIDPFIKQCLIHGHDQIELSLQYSDEIGTFEGDRPGYKPSVHL